MELHLDLVKLRADRTIVLNFDVHCCRQTGLQRQRSNPSSQMINALTLCNRHLQILPTIFPLNADMDACLKCAFSAICPYNPLVSAIDLLRRRFSSLDVSQASMLKDMDNLEQELDVIEPLFVQIRDQREKVLKDLHGCNGLLAPIRCLPRETLLQIFGLASSDIPDPGGVPWILGEVCSTWWSISRFCPSLRTRNNVP
ncbi:hypothetical protein ARMGADRAFT_1087869 [Armillaria gallica]|uniref:F-box domain-containing protein n=1 Tax=Armillaria gallica TaxID=47427 RepID=A0A2H3D7B7_ARMGA|nr:hypothetical protein ARMGADRAFT_1087869 [Armillaria gallica]